MKFKFLQLIVVSLFSCIGTASFAQTTTITVGTGAKLIKSGGETYKLIIGGTSRTNIVSSGGEIIDKDGTTYLKGKTTFSGGGLNLANTPYDGSGGGLNNGPIADFYNLIFDHPGDTSYVNGNISTIFVRNILTPTAGIFNGTGVIVFKSTNYVAESNFPVVVGGSPTTRSVQSAYMARLAPTTCTGTVPSAKMLVNTIVERPIANSLIAARLITPGITPSPNTKISFSWQENSSSNFNNYGIKVYGPGGSTNGFDAPNGANPNPTNSTIAYINSAGTGYSYITATNTVQSQFALGKGLAVTIYGDRTYSGAASVTANENAGTGSFNYTNIRTFGTINQCEFSPSLPTGANMLALVGNPFWAYYDMTQANRANVSATYWYLDPSVKGTGTKRGVYVPVNLANAGPTSPAYIEPGQAILMETTAANATISFPTSGISTSNTYSNGIHTFAKTSIAPQEHIIVEGYIKFNKFPDYHPTAFSTVRVSYSNDFSNEIGEEDSRPYSNGFENITVNRLGNRLSIEGRKPAIKADTIQLSLSKLYNSEEIENAASSYAIKVNTTYLNGDKLYVLYDKDNEVYEKIPSFSNTLFELNIPAGKKNVDNYSILVLDKSYQPLVDYITSKEKLDMAVYPNPSAEYITIKDTKLAGSNLEIIGTNGKTAVSKGIENNENLNLFGLKVDVKNLANGMYVVKLKTTDGAVKTVKFIKE